MTQAVAALITSPLLLGGCGSHSPAVTSTVTTTGSGFATTTSSFEAVVAFTLLDASNAVSSVALSNDSRWLATGCFDSEVRLYSLTDWNKPSFKRFFNESDSPINSVAISADSKWLASGGRDNIARLYLLEGESSVADYNVSDASEDVWSVDVSSDSRWLATGSSDTVARIYSMDINGRPRLRVSLDGAEDATDVVFTIEFSSDLKWFVTGSKDHKVRLYSFHPDWLAPGLARLRLSSVLSEAEDIVYTVACSPDSRWLATGSFDTVVRIYQIDSGCTGEDCATFLHSLQEATDKIVSLAWSADSRWLAAACNDGSLRIYAMSGVEFPRMAREMRGGNYLQSVAFSGNQSEWLATGGDDTIVRVYWKQANSPWDSLPPSTTIDQVSI